MYRFRSSNLEQMAKAALKLKHEDSSLSVALEQAEDWLARLKAMAEEVTLEAGAAFCLGGGLFCPRLTVTGCFGAVAVSAHLEII